MFLTRDKRNYYKKIRDGSRLYVVQRCSNYYGRYLVLSDCGRGQRSSCIVILEGIEGREWKSFADALSEMETFVFGCRNRVSSLHVGRGYAQGTLGSMGRTLNSIGEVV